MSKAFAPPDRSATMLADIKGSINLRIEAKTRQLIDDAAAVMGKTRTEFMIESARRQAIDVLLDQRLFLLEADRYDAFMDALDHPPAAWAEIAVAAAPTSGMAEVAGAGGGFDLDLSAPVPLTAEHDLSGFDCGEPALNDWLRQRALRNESRFFPELMSFVRLTGSLPIFAFLQVRSIARRLRERFGAMHPIRSPFR